MILDSLSSMKRAANVGWLCSFPVLHDYIIRLNILACFRNIVLKRDQAHRQSVPFIASLPMQKVLRRTALAKKQAERRLAARKGKNNSDERKLRANEQKHIGRSVRDDILNARRARREDFLLGPLAPRRDVGDKKDIYGTVGPQRLRGVEKPEGQYKDWGIVQGDRVVIVQDGHRERGKIGTVREVRKAAEECTIQGLNMVNSVKHLIYRACKSLTASISLGRCGYSRLHASQ